MVKSGVSRPWMQTDNDLPLKEKAYRTLEERIVRLEYSPGDALSENALAKELEIGRTPIREAIQRLASEGLVRVFPSRGIIVTDSNPIEYLRLLEARRELERLVCKLAAVRSTSSEIEEFQKLATDFKAARDQANEALFLETDLHFNHLLLHSCHNQFAARCLSGLSGLSRRHFFQYRHLVDIREIASLHEQMALSIAKRDQSASADALDRLMDFNEQYARRAIDLGINTL